jgi:demethylmenaquinone methyltransferase/2-methoxy-6-polyprenyl-1,4-benzoquinol methylase
MTSTAVFARDANTAAYYDRRAPEYDQWYRGEGRFAAIDRPGWHEAVEELQELVRHLAPARTLDIACGTGFLTQHLRGLVVGLDQSPAMVSIAQTRMPDGVAIVGDALDLPFADRSFDRVLTGHFYGHLPRDERDAFLAEARRVAADLVVLDAAVRPGLAAEQWQVRTLNDGSRHRVYKRYLTAAQLADEIGGHVLLDNRWFVAAQATWHNTGQ